MKFSDLPLQPDRRMLRQFAGLWIVFFCGIGCLQLVRSEQITLVSNGAWFVAAFAIGIPALVWPSIIRPVFVTWLVLAFPIGWVVSHIVLFVVFFGVFLPLGLALRKSGHDPLHLNDRDAETYWTPHPQQKDLSRYFRQY